MTAVLAAEIARIAGSEAVVTDPALLAAAAHDVFDARVPPALKVTPATLEALAAVVAAAGRAGAAMVAVGGGASYTLGYAPTRAGTVLIDTSALTRIEAVDETALTATVEPGVTWAALDAALKPRGLRATFWGPYSGARATIAGSASQHAVSLGSGLWETSASAVLGLEMIDAQGRRFWTDHPAPPLRAHGPDVTGLFLGDAGALGVKARVVLRLMRRPSHVAALAFAFEGFAPMAQAMGAVAGRLIASEIMGLDPELQRGVLGALTTEGRLAAVRSIWSTSPGPFAAARTLLSAAFAAAPAARTTRFAAYFTVEGWSALEVRAKAQTVRALAAAHGVEIANGAPLSLRGDPFLPLTPVAPPDGGRWLPTHGVFTPAGAAAFHGAFESWKAARVEAFAALGVRMTRMFVAVGAGAMVYEPTFYWPDGRTPAQNRLAPAAHLKALPVLPENVAVREQVFAWRRELTDLMDAHGAQHFQLGKWYRFLSARDGPAREVLLAVKRTVDPAGLFNPGALEFP